MSEFLSIHLSLPGLSEAVWRRFAIRANASLLDLHRAIRDFGWLGYAGWEMMTAEGRFLAGHDPECDDQPGPEAGRPLRSVLQRAGDALHYIYDLDERFEHKVRYDGSIEGPETARRSLFDGGGRFPPEGCGGAAGYERILARSTRRSATDERLIGCDDDGWMPGDFRVEEERERWDRHLLDLSAEERSQLGLAGRASPSRRALREIGDREPCFQSIMTELASTLSGGAVREHYWSTLGLLSARDDLVLVLRPKPGGYRLEIRDPMDRRLATWLPVAEEGPCFRLEARQDLAPKEQGRVLELLGLPRACLVAVQDGLEIRLGEEPGPGLSETILDGLAALAEAGTAGSAPELSLSH